MLVRCPSCRSAYRLDAGRVPESGVRVRCPRCAHVFRLRAAPAGEARPAPVPAPPCPASASDWNEALPGLVRDLREPPRFSSRPAPGSHLAETAERPTTPERRVWNPGAERTLQLDALKPDPATPPPRLETPPFRPGQTPAPAPARPAVRATAPGATASTTAPAAAPGTDPELRRTHERARRLARVLVSDLLVYNQETRDRGLREGNLMALLGVEINKAWELYKAKVSGEVVGTTTYFKDALNEILAEGDKIF